MSPSDIIATIGVCILLLAFGLNAIGKWRSSHWPYLSFNFVGAAFAALSAWMIAFYPFVILEGTWALVSLVVLIKNYRPRGS